jgi:hypothetical protein
LKAHFKQFLKMGALAMMLVLVIVPDGSAPSEPEAILTATDIQKLEVESYSALVVSSYGLVSSITSLGLRAFEHFSNNARVAHQDTMSSMSHRNDPDTVLGQKPESIRHFMVDIQAIAGQKPQSFPVILDTDSDATFDCIRITGNQLSTTEAWIFCHG